MRVAALVLAHDQPAHLARLLAALDDPAIQPFVHLDARSPAGAFGEARRSRARFVEPLRVYWGGYSIVAATLRLIEHARAAGPFDYYALLSGADYPLCSTEALCARLAQDPGTDHISLAAMPSPETSKLLSRLYLPHLEGSQGTGPLAVAQRLVNRTSQGLAIRFPVLRRDHERALGGWQPYGGAQWWCLTDRTIDWVLRAIRERPELERLFRYTWAPDEVMLHTIIGNAPEPAPRRPSLTYTRWNAPRARHPEILDERAIDALIVARDRGALFARKLTDASWRLARQIDVRLRGLP